MNENINDTFFNFKPIILDNIFTGEELNEVYDTRFRIAPASIMPDGSQYVFKDESCGYITSVYPLKQHLLNKIESIIQNNVPIKIKSDGNHMPRYTLESGSKPQLRPHYDIGMKSASFTLSIQLDYSKDWQICVKDQCFTLKKNQALLFSGSHQVHWRPNIEFDKNDYYDIIVCQAVEDLENPLLLDETHRKFMEKEADYYMNKYFNFSNMEN